MLIPNVLKYEHSAKLMVAVWSRNPAWARLAAIATQVHWELFGTADAGDGERGVVSVE